MRKLAILIMALTLFLSVTQFANAHPGRTDASGGHNCSDNAKKNELCTGYHFHDANGNPIYPGKAGNSSAKPKTTTQPAITVKINGETLSFSQPPVIKNGSTLVPMRAIFEYLGATVSWDQSNQKVTGKKGNSTVVLYINKTEALLNGSSYILNQPAILINGRTLVPLRFIGESLGATVHWDQATKSVSISN
ncbi:copper amine oxidase N-terminal domain-containing protein [bacterium LRH843]|nr:copper amine oxidase N-terminal domain-containing protein [bacterium LRH843]